MLLTIYIAFVLTAWAAGLAGGWWLRSRGVQPAEAPVDKDEVRRAQELLACLQKMASTVAVELGEHSTRVEEINVELTSDKLHEPAKILNVVTKLVDVNKTMQGRLDQAEDRLREQVRLVESHAAEARTDALTLVGNRRAFETDIAQCLAEFRGSGKPFTLAMIDLDKFKRFNDTYGHQAGDEVLRGTGRVLRRVLRESESIARYGGEEFAVIFNRSTVADVQRALTRLRKAIAKTEFPGPSGKLDVTISLGAAQSQAKKRWSRSSSGPTLHCMPPKKRAATAAIGTMAGRSCRLSTRKQTRAAARTAQAGRSLQAGGDRLRPRSWPTIFRAAEPHGLLPARPRPRGRVEAGWPDAVAGARGNRRLQKPRPALRPETPRSAGDQPRPRRLCGRPRNGHGRPLQYGLFGFPVAQCGASGRHPRGRTDSRGGQPDDVYPNGTKLGFTVSVGLIEAGSADDLVALFRKAESALEAAHQHGGNCLFHHDGEQLPVGHVRDGAAA